MILNNNKNTGFGSISGGGSGGGTGGVDKIYVDGLTNSLKNSKFDKVEYDATDNSLVFYANNVEKARVVLPAGSGREIELKYEDDKIKYKYDGDADFTELVDLSAIAGGGGTIDSDSGTMSAVGGIPAGTNLKGKTALEVLNMVFFPYTKPVVSSVTLNRTPTGNVLEVGTTVNINSITTSVVKKSSPITAVQFFVNNAKVHEVTSGVSNGGSFSYTPTSSIAITSNISNSYIHVKCIDEKGGETVGNSTAITFVYPFYYGVVSDGAVLTETLIKGLTKDVSIKGNKSYTFTTSNNCMCIAYPSSYGNLTKIVDMNGFDITGSFTKSQVTINSVNYNVYVSNSNTNSNFKVNFNF